MIVVLRYHLGNGLFFFQEEFYGKEVIVATREMVELESDAILKDADKVDVAFLVVGDPLG
jgi:diphthine synthase